jgi:hypothetical protein
LVTGTVPLVSYADFARRVGVSRPAISKASSVRLRDAVVTKNGKPMLNLERALELWSAGNQRQARGRAAPPPPPVPAALPSPEAVAEAVRLLPDDAIPDLGISLERKEHYRAELAKIEAMHRREELGSIADMKREAFGLAKSVREAVLAIVPRVSSDLAAAGDRFEVEQLLEEELTAALRVLADG